MEENAQVWVCVPALPLAGCVTLGRSSYLENFVLTHHDGKGQWLFHDVAGGSKGEQVQRDR